jgi:hypothetical protein
MTLRAHVGGLGVLGPGLVNWRETAAVLSGQQTYHPAPTQLPSPAILPPAERRRMGRVVKLALGVALEAMAQAREDSAELASVFTSSGADGENCHEICHALSLTGREVSPTRFANSVHNAAAGYWSIGTGEMAASTVLCALDASFAAGLLEALTQVVVDRIPVLLVAYDAPFPPPLHQKRPILESFGTALILTPDRRDSSLARIDADLTDLSYDRLTDPGLEALRSQCPAARALPLLRLLARQSSGTAILEYLDVSRLEVRIEPCL